jgi:hypothetical protein
MLSITLTLDIITLALSVININLSFINIKLTDFNLLHQIFSVSVEIRITKNNMKNEYGLIPRFSIHPDIFVYLTHESFI